MKKIILIMSLSFISIVACKSAPVATGPEEGSGFKTTEATNQNAKGYNLPDGAAVRETPRGKVLVLHDPKSKTDIGKSGNASYEVKFGFDNTVEIGSYKEAYNLVYQIIKNNPDIRIMVEGNSSKEGPAPYNYQLSQRRADTSFNYIIKLGAENSKLLKNAFGEALPEYPTLKENRRCEFIIIMNEDDLKKYNDFAKTVDINKETN
ncbi:OmpA family protein [Brachyspira sp. G79]|uniref:OmpA family protein n=1 Tax=Brachyspira sp. G79 TaxID=1358104 RepID=UPI000BBC50BB|nr:OmpA family protein [Brachyspira sp. G79]PCG20777.1 membrane protein [Brachyspira sp. G79]